MAAIFLPIGIGIAIGLALCATLAGIAVCAFLVALVLTPLVIFLSHFTPQGRIRWEAKKAAFREYVALPRGSAERRAALARYKAI